MWVVLLIINLLLGVKVAILETRIDTMEEAIGYLDYEVQLLHDGQSPDLPDYSKPHPFDL